MLTELEASLETNPDIALSLFFHQYAMQRAVPTVIPEAFTTLASDTDRSHRVMVGDVKLDYLHLISERACEAMTII